MLKYPWINHNLLFVVIYATQSCLLPKSQCDNMYLQTWQSACRVEEAGENQIRTEADLGKHARELFRTNKESVILVSSTNLDSIMEFYPARPWGMDFVCDAYQAKLMLAAMEDKAKYYRNYNPEMIHGKHQVVLGYYLL